MCGFTLNILVVIDTLGNDLTVFLQSSDQLLIDTEMAGFSGSPNRFSFGPDGVES
jgi:hypothetical protein